MQTALTSSCFSPIPASEHMERLPLKLLPVMHDSLEEKEGCREKESEGGREEI